MKSLKKLIVVAMTIFSILNSCAEPKQIKENSSKNNHNGIIIFTYDTKENKFLESRIKKRMDELTTGSKRFDDPLLNDKNLPINEWYKREAKKYGAKINIELNQYPNQIQIPKEYLNPEGSDSAIKLSEFLEYLKKDYPSLQNYDFVGIIYNSMLKSYKYKGYALGNKKIFYMQNFNALTLNEGFAHELGHCFGGGDKYTNNPENYYDIMGPFNKDSYYGKDNAIHGYNLNDKDIVSEPTAKEFGWEIPEGLVVIE